MEDEQEDEGNKNEKKKERKEKRKLFVRNEFKNTIDTKKRREGGPLVTSCCFFLISRNFPGGFLGVPPWFLSFIFH
jgi:hypothetical protein